MTNEQAKQEAIKKAISDYYDKYPLVKPYVQNNNGYLPITNGYIKNLNENVRRFYYSLDRVDYLTEEDHEEYNSHFRPKELSDILIIIEHNNGWVRIELDGSNLPKLMISEKEANKDLFKACYFNTNVSNHVKTVSDLHYAFFKDGSTHYKTLEKELLPIY